MICDGFISLWAYWPSASTTSGGSIRTGHCAERSHHGVPRPIGNDGHHHRLDQRLFFRLTVTTTSLGEQHYSRSMPIGTVSRRRHSYSSIINDFSFDNNNNLTDQNFCYWNAQTGIFTPTNSYLPHHRRDDGIVNNVCLLDKWKSGGGKKPCHI